MASTNPKSKVFFQVRFSYFTGSSTVFCAGKRHQIPKMMIRHAPKIFAAFKKRSVNSDAVKVDRNAKIPVTSDIRKLENSVIRCFRMPKFRPIMKLSRFTAIPINSGMKYFNRITPDFMVFQKAGVCDFLINEEGRKDNRRSSREEESLVFWIPFHGKRLVYITRTSRKAPSECQYLLREWGLAVRLPRRPTPE